MDCTSPSNCFTKQSEKLIEKKLVEAIRKAGGKALKLSAQYDAGLPDRLCLLPEGVAFFVELKTTGKKPTLLQKHTHAQLEALGFKVYVIDKSEQIKGLL